MTARQPGAGDLAERVARATAPDEALTRAAHEMLGWHQRKVTRLSLNGRTPGSMLWFPPGGTKGRRYLPCVSGPRVRARLITQLRALAAIKESNDDGR